MIQIAFQPVSSLTELQRDACQALAETALPLAESTDMADYLHERFQSYPFILHAQDDMGLAAFQLIDAFPDIGEHFYYMGPLFSRRRAYLPMFLEYFRSTWQKHSHETFHMLAELQNPDLLLTFKTLFRRTSYPALDALKAPAPVQKTAQIYANRLAHITHFQPSSLSSHHAETLYRPGSGPEAVISWLHARGIEPEKGGSQMLLLSCPPCTEARSAIDHDLKRGLLMLRHWSRFRPFMLKKFKEALPVG
ncbi:hypothetical protein [Brevibacillus borstelensis]|uniref:hypothetical protein n=1 Tax=Brevibacillus borstelensis TaxID=45462 RepID=UPI0030C06B7C